MALRASIDPNGKGRKMGHSRDNERTTNRGAHPGDAGRLGGDGLSALGRAELVDHISRRKFVALSAASVATLLGSASLALSFPAIARADENGDITLLVRTAGDPVSFNPDATADDNLSPAAANMYNMLTRLSYDYEVLPGAAQSWDISDDAMTITFHLRDDLSWSDGEPLTSADVKYTIEAIRDNEALYASSNVANVASIETPDDYTAVFHMTQPDMSFISIIGWYATYILPKHVFDNGQSWDENPASKEPVTSGPFRLEEYRQGQSYTLVRNDDYYDVPAVKRITYVIVADETTAVQALYNGELDIYPTFPSSQVAQAQANPDLRVSSEPGTNPSRLIFNVADDNVCADLAVRTAVALCIDRDDVNAKVYAGLAEPEYTMYPRAIPWAVNETDLAPGLDLEAAEQALVDAGYTKNDNGYYIEGLRIDVFNDQYLQTAKLVGGNLEKIGVKVEINQTEFNAWYEKVAQRHDFDIEIMGGSLDPDPQQLKLRLGTGYASNFGQWSNEEFDAVTDEANAEPDEEKRAELWRQAQKIMVEELPWVPIVSVNKIGVAWADLSNLPWDKTDDAGHAWGENELTYVTKG